MQNSNYNHINIENDIYNYWEKNKFFKPKKNEKKHFSIVIPPPNVTGSLHMGHALNNSLQDLLVRYYRMNGYETLWQPGTDHAGIATQAVVEKKLLEKGIKKKQLGRDKFIKEVWKWKEESGDQILNQLKKLGCSCDWSRNRFTMDKDLSEAVIKTFVQLYKEKIIYKDTKLVNWDTKLETAISDLEVEQKEVQSNLYYIKYKIDREENFLTIATTRPETMLGDTAVAVNPNDERYQNYIGKKIVVPIVERKVKIIADKHVSIDQGSGALKVTPAHDFNDYEIGKRHKLEFINIFEKNGKLNTDDKSEIKAKEKFIFSITENGFGKRTSHYEFRVTNRSGKGIIGIINSVRNGNVSSSFPVNDGDEILISTNKGRVIRVAVKEIRVAGRNTQGVRIIKLSGDEKVVSATRIDDNLL